MVDFGGAITCKSGITIRTSTAKLREVGRATQGVKLIKIDEGDEIAAISKIQEQEEPVAVTDENDVTGEDGVVSLEGEETGSSTENSGGEDKTPGDSDEVTDESKVP